MTDRFDVFCSYAHVDNDEGWVANFATAIGGTYRRLTGEPLRLFLDREALTTADIWERRIRSALEASRVLLAVVSPSYVRSEWCRREWDYLSAKEDELRNQGLLAEEQGLIFPVLLYPLDRGHFSQEQSKFSNRIRQRQWLDASSQLDGVPIRPNQVRFLTEQIIDTVVELDQRRRRAAGVLTSAETGITIRDTRSGLEWSSALSPTELTFEEAVDYVKQLAPGGGGRWRLPTKDELASLLNPLARADDSGSSPYPLREPFSSQRSGYLHSGTLVGDHEGNYIMNVYNGHIFNGLGYRCYVRPVRTLQAVTSATS